MFVMPTKKNTNEFEKSIALNYYDILHADFVKLDPLKCYLSPMDKAIALSVSQRTLRNEKAQKEQQKIKSAMYSLTTLGLGGMVVLGSMLGLPFTPLITIEFFAIVGFFMTCRAFNKEMRAKLEMAKYQKVISEQMSYVAQLDSKTRFQIQKNVQLIDDSAMNPKKMDNSRNLVLKARADNELDIAKYALLGIGFILAGVSFATSFPVLIGLAVGGFFLASAGKKGIGNYKKMKPLIKNMIYEEIEQKNVCNYYRQIRLVKRKPKNDSLSNRLKKQLKKSEIINKGRHKPQPQRQRPSVVNVFVHDRGRDNQ